VHKVRAPICQFAWLALSISCGLCLSQTPNGAHSAAGEAAVHLEPHAGRTIFRIGEPVILDLVFASRSPGYVVKTDDNPHLPASDQVDIAPDGGWVRTQASFRGQALNGNAITTLAGDPIRVPVLLNRTITFLKPGHYEVTVTTERLLKAENMMVATSLESCEPCRVTNAIGIDISEADNSQESALVLSLARKLEDTAKPTDNRISPEQKAAIDHLQLELRQSTGSTEADHKRQEALLQELGTFVVSQESAAQKRTDARREAAVRLACLDGDDAVRAKVHFIAAETQEDSGDPNIGIAWILVDGLASSRNKQMQLALVEGAWRDPKLLPTPALQMALRQARELTQKDWVTDESVIWAGTPEQRQATLQEYQREVNEIIATLPLRSESNRTETINFLKALGVPNPFNQSHSPTQLSK
jgi:hypothetical protein